MHHTRKNRSSKKKSKGGQKSKGGSKNKSNALKKTTSSKKSRKINKRKIGGNRFISGLTSVFGSPATVNDEGGGVDNFYRHGSVTDLDRKIASEVSSLTEAETEKIIIQDRTRDSLLEEYKSKNILDTFKDFKKKFKGKTSDYESLFTFMDNYIEPQPREDYYNIVNNFMHIIKDLKLTCCIEHKNANEKEMVGNYAYIILQKLIEKQ